MDGAMAQDKNMLDEEEGVARPEPTLSLPSQGSAPSASEDDASEPPFQHTPPAPMMPPPIPSPIATAAVTGRIHSGNRIRAVDRLHSVRQFRARNAAARARVAGSGKRAPRYARRRCRARRRPAAPPHGAPPRRRSLAQPHRRQRRRPEHRRPHLSPWSRSRPTRSSSIAGHRERRLGRHRRRFRLPDRSTPGRWSARASTLLARPTTFLTVAAIVVPIAVLWLLALLAWRADELRLRSSTMTEVAIRLAEPDRWPSRSIASLGQAVRRQVVVHERRRLARPRPRRRARGAGAQRGRGSRALLRGERAQDPRPHPGAVGRAPRAAQHQRPRHRDAEAARHRNSRR